MILKAFDVTWTRINTPDICSSFFCAYFHVVIQMALAHTHLQPIYMYKLIFVSFQHRMRMTACGSVYGAGF